MRIKDRVKQSKKSIENREESVDNLENYLSIYSEYAIPRITSRGLRNKIMCHRQDFQRTGLALDRGELRDVQYIFCKVGKTTFVFWNKIKKTEENDQ